jgi:hypothetical protein
LEALAEKRGAAEALVARRLIEWSRARMSRLTWGRGKVDGSFVPVLDDELGRPHYPLAVYTYGRLEIQFQWLRQPPFSDVKMRQELRRRLNKIQGVSITDDALTRRPSIPLALLASDPQALSDLVETLDWFCDAVAGNASEPQ